MLLLEDFWPIFAIRTTDGRTDPPRCVDASKNVFLGISYTVDGWNYIRHKNDSNKQHTSQKRIATEQNQRLRVGRELRKRMT